MGNTSNGSQGPIVTLTVVVDSPQIVVVLANIGPVPFSRVFSLVLFGTFSDSESLIRSFRLDTLCH